MIWNKGRRRWSDSPPDWLPCCLHNRSWIKSHPVSVGQTCDAVISFFVCVSWIKSTQCHHQSRCVSSLSNSRWKLRCFNFADLESVFLLNPETMRECEKKTKKTCQCPRICRNFMNLFFIHFLCSCYFLTLGEIREMLSPLIFTVFLGQGQFLFSMLLWFRLNCC